jgi:predicted DCC family thiol-disulfide oxidoreductase YuxK
MTEENYSIVLFDGVCNLCDATVRLIFAHDPAGKFRFAPLQSELGQELSAKHGHRETNPDAPNSVLLIEDGTLYDRSTAALRIAGQLSGPMRFLGVLLWLPRPLRDLGYKLVASVRYRIWGKKESCTLPPAGLRDRFLTL